MQQEVFSGSALVEIQGAFVLRFLERKPTHVIYKILSFNETIMIHDYRLNGLQAIDKVMASDDMTFFPSAFSKPALVSIFDNNKEQPVLITLQDTCDPSPIHKLYIAIGLSDEIPIYHYIFGRIQQINNHNYALVGLIQPEAEVADESLPPAFCTI